MQNNVTGFCHNYLTLALKTNPFLHASMIYHHNQDTSRLSCYFLRIK